MAKESAIKLPASKNSNERKGVKLRISRMEIINHNRIKDLNVEVRKHAVIMGANDVGKSSILRMLNLTLGASIASLYRELSPNDI